MILLPIEDRNPGKEAECTTSSERRETYDSAFELEIASSKDEDN